MNANRLLHVRAAPDSSSTLNCVTPGSTFPSCPAGTSLNSSITSANRTITVQSNGIFIHRREVRCSANLFVRHFQLETGNCVLTLTQSANCPASTSLNVSDNLCEAPYACSSGSTYSPSDGKCDATPTCASGIFNPGTSNCVLTLTQLANCPASTSLNVSDNLCEAAYVCPNGSTYSATDGKCDAAPTCRQGRSTQDK